MGEQVSGVLARVKLDHGSPVPLYHQAARALEEAIEDGRLPRGGRLEGEISLAEQLGISRPTMREAIKRLVEKGLLIRKRGIGTMVAPKPVRRAVALTSLYDDLKESGREPRTRVLSFKEVPCPPEIADQLGIAASTPMLRFERLRVAGLDPIALMRNFIPVDLLEIDTGSLEQSGLYELMREGGVTPHMATQAIGARKAGSEEVERLEIEPGDPVLTMSRVAYDPNGRPLEHGYHRYPAESYWFEMMLMEL
ncbi:MAG: GntR family transcriptional regulator [Rubrobacteraceae bacterium]